MGVEKEESFGLNWVETTFRGYDAVLGRFHQVDPLGDEMYFWSIYSYSFDNPIFFNDPLGLKPSDDFIFNKDGKLSQVVNNDKPDRYFQEDGNGNTKELNIMETTREMGEQISDFKKREEKGEFGNNWAVVTIGENKTNDSNNQTPNSTSSNSGFYWFNYLPHTNADLDGFGLGQEAFYGAWIKVNNRLVANIKV